MNKVFNGRKCKVVSEITDKNALHSNKPELLSSTNNPIAEKLKKELEKISIDKPKRKYIKVQFN